MIFKAVGEGRPCPDHGLVSPKAWQGDLYLEDGLHHALRALQQRAVLHARVLVL